MTDTTEILALARAAIAELAPTRRVVRFEHQGKGMIAVRTSYGLQVQSLNRRRLIADSRDEVA